MGLRRGEAVEVCSDEEGYKGAWYPATLIRKRGLQFVIEFKGLVTDDEKSKLRERVEADQIRPVPPSLNRQYFIPREIVDAYDKDGWWVGTIESVLADNNYVVHFSHSGEKLEYNVSQLRLHLDWVDGNWLQPSEPSDNTNSISPKPDRVNTRPNKFKREATVCGLSADGLCASLKNAESQPNEKSTKPKRRKTTKDIIVDDALPGTGAMNSNTAAAARHVECAKGVPPHKEGEKNHSSGLNANITKETEVPFSEARLEVENILHTPCSCETGAKATLKQMELLAYHSVLKALYLQGDHNLKVEVLLADLREVLHISNEESASQLRRISYGQNH